MALQYRKNTDEQGLAGPMKRENPFLLSQRQHLIQKLNALLYDVQRSKIADDKISDILKLLSHV